MLAFTYIYLHLLTFTCMHLHTLTCTYTHLHTLTHTYIYLHMLKIYVIMTSKQLQCSALAATKLQALSNKPQCLNFTLSDLVKHNLIAKRTIGKVISLKHIKITWVRIAFSFLCTHLSYFMLQWYNFRKKHNKNNKKNNKMIISPQHAPRSPPLPLKEAALYADDDIVQQIIEGPEQNT